LIADEIQQQLVDHNTVNALPFVQYVTPDGGPCSSTALSR
jgi:hypothetical protein